MQLACYLLSNFILTFFSYLIKSSLYNVPASQAGGLVGAMGFYAQLVCLFFDFALGTIMDICGRKMPIIIGLYVASIALMGMPFVYYTYPWLLILR
jgi:MFS family permease